LNRGLIISSVQGLYNKKFCSAVIFGKCMWYGRKGSNKTLW